MVLSSMVAQLFPDLSLTDEVERAMFVVPVVCKFSKDERVRDGKKF